MGLPTILTLFHLVSGTRARTQDLERNASEKPDVVEQEDGGDGLAEDVEGGMEPDNVEDDDSYDPLSDPARRLHRLGSATDTTFFGSDVKHLSRYTTGNEPHQPWYKRVKNYVFPPEESDAALEKFVPNYRWTPIISGVVVPFALLLEIPGLTEHWYIRTEGTKIAETRSNPVILDVGLALSMVCGLCANICLILRFLEKWVKTVTLLTMVFLTVHGSLSLLFLGHSSYDVICKI